MITKVRLRNWKSHLDSEMGFSRGVNALVGIMGSGKSSVVDAISFGLFGTFPALQGRKVVLDNLIMERPQRKGEAEVRVDFSAGGKSYSVRRIVKRGKGSSAELREEGELKEVSSRGVTREVERVFGMDYEVFSKAVYSEQDGIDYFLKIPSGRRREHIDRMLRLDRFEFARGEAVSLQNQLRSGREERLRIMKDMEKEGLEEKLKKLEGELKACAEEERTLLERLGGVGKAREEAGKRLERMEEGRKRLERARIALEGLRGALEEIREREGRDRKIVRGRDLGRIDMDIKRLESGLEEGRREADSLKGELHSLMERERMISEGLEEIRGLEGKCPLCESEIPPGKREALAGSRERALLEIEDRKAKVRMLMRGKEDSLRSAESVLEEKRVERDRVSRAFQEIREMEGKLSNLAAAKERNEAELKASEGLEEGIEGLREEFQELASREREMRVEARSLREMREAKEGSREEAAKRLRTLEEYREELRLGEEVTGKLEAFGKALKLTQEQLRTEFLKNVNAVMDSVWRELYPYGDFDSVRLSAESGDYSLQLRAGGWVDVEGIASGGERSIASLALRIAFSLTFLPSLRWMILDEPTHNLDSNATAALGEALRERLGGFAEQVFLITHDHSLSEGLENVHRMERDKSKGEATRLAGSG